MLRKSKERSYHLVLMKENCDIVRFKTLLCTHLSLHDAHLSVKNAILRIQALT
ncbi:hypothetical protein A359_08580 [secondary endosymbiont of Ctenarytaina eucalypti]|uniref:Uncharacterized protein n=1 Tax=secondary endosymbiont of Ctenarytaina eucalypti TaxID=1199245 RepID=J3Z4J9_9ENTR|nr:hypothetical protein A359_08580 [secondary endosymbiont of Ctenarytaina eucalypti]